MKKEDFSELKRLHGIVKHHVRKDKELLIYLFMFMFFLFVIPLLLDKGITGNAGIDVVKTAVPSSAGLIIAILAALVAVGAYLRNRSF